MAVDERNVTLRAKRLADESLSLAEVEAMYGGLVEALPAIVYVAEPVPPYATIYVSRQVEGLGFTLEEWLAKPDRWLEILHEEDRERVLRTSEQAFAEGGESDLEYRVVAKDGSVHWLHDRGRFVRGEGGEPICWQGVLLDVTARKAAEAEREALIAGLQGALAEIRTLSGLLPLCSYCRKVRNDDNYWQGLEQYIAERSSAQFSHGICPECYERHVAPEVERLRARAAAPPETPD
jgi:PAS domain S-box-containing protein